MKSKISSKLIARTLVVIAFLLVPLSSFAWGTDMGDYNPGPGCVNYNGGLEPLNNLTGWILAYAVIVMSITSAIAAIVGVVGSVQIAVKIGYGEGDATKSMIMFFGSLLFLLFSYIVIPGMFGFDSDDIYLLVF